MIHNLNRLAELALNGPYYTRYLHNEDELNEYLEPVEREAGWSDHDHLTRAIGDDIHDLLHNGNDEDLGWSEADTETLRDDDYYDNIDRLSSLLAAKIISRIRH